MDLALLSKIGILKKFEPQDFICIENDLGDNMYILLKGKVGVYLNSFMDDSFKVSELDPGCFFGEMSLLENMPRSATVIASDEGATVIEIHKDHFHQLLGHSDIAYRITKSLLDRIKRMLDEFSDKDNSKFKSFAEDPAYLAIAGVSEENFNILIKKEYQKIFNMIKHLSKMIRNINEELTDLAGEKQLNSVVDNLSNLDLIPKGHQQYTFEIKQDFGDILIERSMKCPVCGKEFKQLQKKKKKIRLNKIENDLRKIYENFDPLWFNICTCPDCFYSNYSNDFNVLPPKYIKDAKERLLQASALKSVLALDALDINRIFAQYYLTMLCSVVRHMKDLKQGKLWLNLSWLYKDVGDEKMHVYAYEKAFEYYNSSYLHSGYQLSESDEQSLCIIIGEIYVRKGKYEDARKILFEATRFKNGNKELSNRASQSIYDIKELVKGEH